MTLRANLLEELQKLRQSRERIPIKQAGVRSSSSKLSKKDKLLEEARQLLDLVGEEEE